MMNNEISKIEKSKNNLVPSDPNMQVVGALQSSIYPGANPDSIEMVLNYCRAANLDPLQKPVHIVPMSVKDSKTGQYRYRDVLMPGIGLYRTQASRSQQYAGLSEPDYGKTLTLKTEDSEMAYPEWCKITVKKIVNGMIVEFTACEYWIENYATAKKGTKAPNAMWRKRPFGQLAKCAEAQALRKAFPELVSHQPTYEEMSESGYETPAAQTAESIAHKTLLEPEIVEEVSEAKDSDDGLVRTDEWDNVKKTIENHRKLDNEFSNSIDSFVTAC